MRRFFTPQRVVISCVGLIAGLALSIAAASSAHWVFDWSSLWLNLAASAFTITFTVVIVDYIIQRVEEARAKRTRGLTRRAVAELLDGFTLELINVYEYAYAPALRLDKDPRKWTAQLRAHMTQFLENIDFETARHDNEVAAEYPQVLAKRIADMDEVWRLYGFALPEGVRGSFLELRKLTKGLSSAFEEANVDSEKRLYSLIKNSAPWLRDALIDLGRELENDFR